MALVRILGRGLFYPAFVPPITVPSFVSGTLVDATGEMAAMCGKIVWFDMAKTSTRAIRKAYWRFGAIVKAGGSVLTASLQDVDNANGPPMQPDGTQDQTYTIANADANFASGVWYGTGAFSADRTVSYGDKVALNVEFDGSGRLGADSFVIQGYTAPTNVLSNESCLVNKTGGSWGLATTSIPNAIFEFADGGFGTFEWGTCYKTINTHTYNSGSAADELALAFRVTFPCVVDGLWAVVFPSAGNANFDLVLYDGTTALASSSVDGNAVGSSAGKPMFVPIAEQTLTVNHTYYVAVKPTTANNVSAYSLDVNSANYWTTQDGGLNFNFSQRVDAGAWDAVTTTRRLMAGFRISQLDSGGGMIQSRVFTGA